MGRSLWKGPYISRKLLIKAVKELEVMPVKQSGTKTAVKRVKTWSRSSIILPDWIGLNLDVYNGRKFIPVTVTERMIGHKLGEFALTRIVPKHPVLKGKRVQDKKQQTNKK